MTSTKTLFSLKHSDSYHYWQPFRAYTWCSICVLLRQWKNQNTWRFISNHSYHILPVLKLTSSLKTIFCFWYCYQIVNRGEWLLNSSKFFFVCYCSVFWPWPRTKHNSCLLRTEELTYRKVLLRNSCIVFEEKPKDCAGSWTFQHKSWHLCFVPLMFAELPNQSPLLTMGYTPSHFFMAIQDLSKWQEIKLRFKS